jgi:hypothetical protein
LQIGYPSAREWPPLVLDEPDRWFPLLYETKVTRYLRKGYRRTGYWHDHERDAFPFFFSPTLQKAIFDRCVALRPPASERAVLDCYFTSYFNAWLDNHNLYTGPKKVVTGFAPRMQMRPGNLEHFFAAYPDGYLVTVIRDPSGWYSSARRHDPSVFSEIEHAMPVWRKSAEASLDAAARYGDRVLVLTYERLVLETELTLQQVCERIGLTMLPILLTPTFNSVPIAANSRAKALGYGVLRERTSASRDSLGGHRSHASSGWQATSMRARRSLRRDKRRRRGRNELESLRTAHRAARSPSRMSASRS